MACETDRTVKDFLVGSRIFDQIIKPLLHQETDLGFKTELLVVLCNGLKGASIDHLAYFLKECELVEILSQSLHLSFQNQKVEDLKHRRQGI